MTHFKLYMFLILIVSACQGTNGERAYCEVDSILLNRMHAEDVSMSVINKSTSTDGVTTYENYLQVELVKPKYLLDIKFNQRIYKERRDQLLNLLLDSLTYDSNWKFDELRLRIIEQKSFLIFKGEKSYTETYKIR